MAELHRSAVEHGYTSGGGCRLLQATLKRLYELLQQHAEAADATNDGGSDKSKPVAAAAAAATLALMASEGIIMRYETNVPRQVGLAGSSCIVSAAVKALLKHYAGGGLDAPFGVLPIEKQPPFVLAVEAVELGINAGLMDRVIQVYEGCYQMDFTDPARTAAAVDVYRPVPVAALPPLHVAIADDPSDSGRIHATVRERFAARDPVVLCAAASWAGFVDDAVAALGRCDHERFRALMDANFDLRRELYGDECLGWKNLKMVEIARKHRGAAKFPGSGGAVLVATRPDGVTDVAALAAELEEHGFKLVKLQYYEPAVAASGPDAVPPQ